jgi:transglutaminase-like putative cysteine protease
VSVYRVRHTTRYAYEAPVVHAHHFCHLRPRQFDWQGVAKHELEVQPLASMMRRSTDYFGNQVHLVELLTEHAELDVTSTSVVEVAPRPEPPAAGGIAWDETAERLRSAGALVSALEYCFDSPLVRAHPLLASYAQPVFSPGRPLVAAILEFCRKIFEEFKYETTATDVTTPLAQVLRERRGVCQDFAHLAVGCLRSLGLAARYVSGYLETKPPPGKPRLVGADASHAWASAYVPGFGWLDFDPTNGTLAGGGHVTVAWGRDFSDVSPLKGVVLGGGGHRVTVSVDVEAVEADA